MAEGEGAQGSVQILEKLQTEERSDHEVEMDCWLVVGDGEVGLREVPGLTGVYLVEGNSVGTDILDLCSLVDQASCLGPLVETLVVGLTKWDEGNTTEPMEGRDSLVFSFLV